ncbi:MAG: hypothetical protein LBV04_04690 [Deferribacteraceae bacterium]|jgi:hypothetical protein|nr:hypothetical protein [Deferribacteraceae bacterium]
MNDNNTELSRQQDHAFTERINFLGRYTSIIALLGMFSIPVMVSIFYDIEVNFGGMFAVGVGLIAMFAPMAIVENISYYPVMGAGGVYLSCISGNIMNMKLPCALSGMKIAGVEPGSAGGDVISIICVAVSSLVTTFILFFGMLVVGEFLAPLLSHPVLKPAFDNIMPALMGAVAVPFFIRSPKLAATPLVVSIVLALIMGPTVVQRYQSYILPCIMIL